MLPRHEEKAHLLLKIVGHRLIEKGREFVSLDDQDRVSLLV